MQTYVTVRVEDGGHFLRLMAAHVVADDMNFSAFRLAGHNVSQEGHKLLAAVLPSTSPAAVLNAANRLRVPLRLYSTPWLSAHPGDSGSFRSLRSSDWIAVFSSRQNTAACADGFR